MTVLEALHDGDIETALTLIASGADPLEYDPDEDDHTPLTLAAGEGYVEVVQALLAAGVSPDNGVCCSALNEAVIGGHVEIVRALLDAGADTSAMVDDDCTALISAAASGDIDITRLLIERGADVDAEDAHGRTALAAAIESGNPEVFEYLLPLSDPSIQRRAQEMFEA